MKSRRSDGNPSGKGCSLRSPFHSSSLTLGMTSRLNSDSNSASASLPHTQCGSAQVPVPATERLGDQFHPTRDRAYAGEVASRAPSAANPRPEIRARRLLNSAMASSSFP